MNPEQTLVAVDPEDRASVLEFARENGIEIEDVTTRALEPVTAVSLVLVGSALAVGSVLDFIDRLKGGQVVDLRPDSQRQAYRSKDLAYGLVLIMTADGRIAVEVREPRGVFGQVLDTIRGVIGDAVGQPAGTIEAALRQALGDLATIRRGV